MGFRKLASLLLALSLYLGLSNGHLAIYSHMDSCPLQVLPYDVTMYSNADRDQLQRGIHFSSAAELSRLLEDYTS